MSGYVPPHVYLKVPALVRLTNSNSVDIVEVKAYPGTYLYKRLHPTEARLLVADGLGVIVADLPATAVPTGAGTWLDASPQSTNTITATDAAGDTVLNDDVEPSSYLVPGVVAGQTVFTVPPMVSPNVVNLTIDGVLQPNSSFTVAGNVVTYSGSQTIEANARVVIQWI